MAIPLAPLLPLATKLPVVGNLIGKVPLIGGLLGGEGGFGAPTRAGFTSSRRRGDTHTFDVGGQTYEWSESQGTVKGPGTGGAFVPVSQLPAQVGATLQRATASGGGVGGGAGGTARGGGSNVLDTLLTLGTLGLAGANVVQGARAQGKSNKLIGQAIGGLGEPRSDLSGLFADPDNPFKGGKPPQTAKLAAVRSLVGGAPTATPLPAKPAVSARTLAGLAKKKELL